MLGNSMEVNLNAGYRPDWEEKPVTTEASEPKYYVGLDLGQSKDYTAVIVVEAHGSGSDAVMNVRHIERYKLGTSYPAIVEDVARKLNSDPLKASALIIDATGVGRPVVDMFRQQPTLKGRHIFSVTITGGDAESNDYYDCRVPKRALVSRVQVALQTRKLKIAPELAEAPTLISELMNFQVKITEAANDTYGAWREGQHDDLVLATALACWRASKPVRKLTVC